VLFAWATSTRALAQSIAIWRPRFGDLHLFRFVVGARPGALVPGVPSNAGKYRIVAGATLSPPSDAREHEQQQWNQHHYHQH